jgi:hypothetical protein
VIAITGAAAAPGVVAPFAEADFAGSWAEVVTPNTTTASDVSTVFLISKTLSPRS